MKIYWTVLETQQCINAPTPKKDPHPHNTNNVSCLQRKYPQSPHIYTLNLILTECFASRRDGLLPFPRSPKLLGNHPRKAHFGQISGTRCAFLDVFQHILTHFRAHFETFQNAWATLVCVLLGVIAYWMVLVHVCRDPGDDQEKGCFVSNHSNRIWSYTKAMTDIGLWIHKTASVDQSIDHSISQAQLWNMQVHNLSTKRWMALGGMRVYRHILFCTMPCVMVCFCWMLFQPWEWMCSDTIHGSHTKAHTVSLTYPSDAHPQHRWPGAPLQGLGWTRQWGSRSWNDVHLTADLSLLSSWCMTWVVDTRVERDERHE